MLKKIIITTAFVAVIGLLIFGAVNRTQAKTGAELTNTRQVSAAVVDSNPVIADDTSLVNIPAQRQGSNGRGQGTGGNQANPLPPAPQELSEEETAALLYMREEEKLAHDVYVTLYEQWELPVFQNISRSEQSHTDSIKALLEKYKLADPASTTIGVFSDPELQALYINLVEQGSQSLAAAIKVGAAIEEIDILDLQEDLTLVDNPDIVQVFNNLLNGSYSHLRAFASTLMTKTGETYMPQYLSAEAYQAIVSDSLASNGNGQGGYRGGGGARGGRP